MVREIVCETTIDFEYPPDGAKLPVIDPYDGCQLCCPYCFQWRDQDWNKEILVKTNLPEMLVQELKDWDLTQPLYVGSRCDPYMPIEQHYQLTRRTLQVLHAYEVPCFISTKAGSKAFVRDFELFLEYGEKLTVCVGISNLNQLKTTNDHRMLQNIRAANELAELGVNTWVFITPVLPGITDVEVMISALHEKIPVYLDKLRLIEEKPLQKRFFKFLRASYPELESTYHTLASEGTVSYYKELKRKYDSDPRISFVFADH
jgi:DNA repair photolyase